jgi:hypothetical protein
MAFNKRALRRMLEQKRDEMIAGWRKFHNEELHNFYSSMYFVIILSGVRLSPLGTAATTGLLYQPQVIDDGDCAAI